jgi:hypothetical protein
MPDWVWYLALTPFYAVACVLIGMVLKAMV